MKRDILLGINIDHVATLRQARGTRYPDPVQAALDAEMAGADGITLHMREDLRHIQPRDVKLIKQVMQTQMNLEMAVTDDMLSFAESIKPEHCCFVPEKREELTTEGGLDVISNADVVREGVLRMHAIESEVSLFIDPEIAQIDAAKNSGASTIELHTGCYAEAESHQQKQEELQRIRQAVEYASKLKLVVNAGHGLNYHNVKPIAQIEAINELNIGHAIIARSLFSGLSRAVSDMKQLMLEARRS